MGEREQRIRDLFGQQFEPDGDGFLYRPNHRVQPKRVTRAERNAFTEQFVRASNRMTWGLAAVAMAAITVAVFFDKTREDLGYGLDFTTACVLVLVALFVPLYRYVWRAPARALADRAPAGPARSCEEARALVLTKLRWSQLGGAVAIAAFLIVSHWPRDEFRIGDWVWIGGGGLLVALVAVQAARKWRFGRQH